MTDDANVEALVFERTLAAPIELVWDVWTRSIHLSRWICPVGFTIDETDGDLRPGGAWRTVMRSPEGQVHVCGGEYLDIEQPTLLRMTHAWENDEGVLGHATRVTVTLSAVDDARTEMQFEQVGFKSDESRGGHAEGWAGAFENLASHLGVAEREIVIERVFQAPRELVWAAFTEAEHLEKWWGPAGFTTRVEELDLSVGGGTKYVMTGPDGSEYPVEGVFREVVPGERFVTTDEFGEGHAGDDLPEGTILEAHFDDHPDGTKLTLVMRHASLDEKAKHEEMGVVGGWGSSFDCLDDYLAEK